MHQLNRDTLPAVLSVLDVSAVHGWQSADNGYVISTSTETSTHCQRVERALAIDEAREI
jgi:hypothetical protein